MFGFVTTRDLFLHAHAIIREFGSACYWRCLRLAFFSSRRVTFLECTRVEAPRRER